MLLLVIPAEGREQMLQISEERAVSGDEETKLELETAVINHLDSTRRESQPRPRLSAASSFPVQFSSTDNSLPLI